MSRETWRLTRQTKRFYVSTYRRVGSFLVLSVSLNLILGMMIHHAYFNQPDRHIYATNGATPPEELIPMDEPNETSVPLLATDQEPELENKVMPE